MQLLTVAVVVTVDTTVEGVPAAPVTVTVEPGAVTVTVLPLGAPVQSAHEPVALAVTVVVWTGPGEVIVSVTVTVGTLQAELI